MPKSTKVSKLTFTSRVPELCRQYGYSARDLAYHADIAINTAYAWLENRGVARIDGNLVEKFMRVFDKDHWTDIIVTDNGAGQ